MLLAYVDESYTENEFWLGALICPEEVVIPLTRELNDVVLRASEKFGSPDGAELHGNPLFGGKGDWSKLKPEQRIQVYGEVFEAIAKHDVEIALEGVLSKKLRIRSPHSLTLEYLLERIELRARAHKQSALVIADHVPGAEVYRNNLRFFQEVSTSGYKQLTLSHIADTMHFVPSAASRLVQAVDLITFLNQRMNSGKDAANERVREASERIWNIIEDKVIGNRCWDPGR